MEFGAAQMMSGAESVINLALLSEERVDVALADFAYINRSITILASSFPDVFLLHPK